MHQYRLRAFGWHNGNRHSFCQISSIGGADWSGKWQLAVRFISERELTFTFARCHRSSVTFVRPTQAIKIFRNLSSPFGTMAIH